LEGIASMPGDDVSAPEDGGRIDGISSVGRQLETARALQKLIGIFRTLLPFNTLAIAEPWKRLEPRHSLDPHSGLAQQPMLRVFRTKTSSMVQLTFHTTQTQFVAALCGKHISSCFTPRLFAARNTHYYLGKVLLLLQPLVRQFGFT
jgi:hypothetical protein